MLQTLCVGQGTAKALAILDVVQASEIFRVVLPWFDVEIDEDWAIFVQDTSHARIGNANVIVPQRGRECIVIRKIRKRSWRDHEMCQIGQAVTNRIRRSI